jgi:AraC-like DNA-binding protein
MQTRIERFDDVHLHACAILGWQQTYDQLSTGSANTLLKHVMGERFQIFQEVLDKRVVQQGVAPVGRLCLAMPMSLSEPVLFQGKSVNAESVSLLHGGQEFSVQAAQGMELLAMTVATDRFEYFADRELTNNQLRILGSTANLELAHDLLNTIRQRLLALVAATQANVHFPENIVEDATLQSMLDLIDHGIEQDRARQGNHTVSAYLVRQSQELALANSEEPITVLEICEHLKVSRRTLQRSFLNVTGMRPVEYLRSVRLNAVRRRLRATCAENFTVSRVASDFGFTHLGHFAGSYKALFAEQPSETPRAR